MMMLFRVLLLVVMGMTFTAQAALAQECRGVCGSACFRGAIGDACEECLADDERCELGTCGNLLVAINSGPTCGSSSACPTAGCASTDTIAVTGEYTIPDGCATADYAVTETIFDCTGNIACTRCTFEDDKADDATYVLPEFTCTPGSGQYQYVLSVRRIDTSDMNCSPATEACDPEECPSDCGSSPASILGSCCITLP